MNQPEAIPTSTAPASRRLTLEDVAREPFRVFFPLGLVAGLLGVSLWPLHLHGLLASYPGLSHARLMAQGFFGGFILGFLGTALPRMLSVKSLRPGEVLALLGLHGTMVGAYFCGRIAMGDKVLLALVSCFVVLMGIRLPRRKDLPPPGFGLVALAFACVAGGAAIALWQDPDEPVVFLVNLQHLLSYQGFVLLPILGVGPYFLPGILGLPNRHDFPTSRTPPEGWTPKALAAATVGAVVVVSFFLEAAGWFRTGSAIRLLVVGGWLALEIPFHRTGRPSTTFGVWLQVGLFLLLMGLLAGLVFPEQRIALLHLTLMGGFALVTLIAATRVVFGHCGQGGLLHRHHRWMHVAGGLMGLAVLARASADFFPKIMASHYTYGGMLWMAGASIWGGSVLPKVLIPDHDD